MVKRQGARGGSLRTVLLREKLEAALRTTVLLEVSEMADKPQIIVPVIVLDSIAVVNIFSGM